MFNKIKGLINNHLKYKLSAQLIWSFLAMYAMIVALSFVILYSGIVNILENNSKRDRIQRFTQFAYNINNFCDGLDLISRRLVVESNLQELVGYSKMSDSDKTYYAGMVLGKFSTIMSNYDYIDSILYYGSDGLIIKDSASGNYISYDQSKSDWYYHAKSYQQSVKNKQKMIWFGGYTDYDFGLLRQENKNAFSYYISASRNVFSIGDSGALIININMDYFTSIYDSLENDSESIYIIDAGGTILSSQDKSMIGKSSSLFQNIDVNQDMEVVKANGKYGQEQMAYCKLASSGMILVSEVPMREITKDAITLRSILIVLFFISFLFALILSGFWIYKLLKPLHKLTSAMGKVERGNLGLTIENPQKNEIGMLVKQFNVMSTSIEDLFNHNAIIEAEKRDLEFETLRSQINPHFIYNTLNTIKWALIKKEDNIVDSITTLSDFLEPVFKNNNIMCRVSEEIEYIKNYVKIMNYRFTGGFTLNINIPEEYMECKIIRFILQPVVENAITHGLMDQITGIISISMWSEGSNAFMMVENSGNEISDSKISEMNQLLSRPPDKNFSGVGLTNVNRRLKLYFGEECGVTFKKSPCGNTEVILKTKLIQKS